MRRELCTLRGCARKLVSSLTAFSAEAAGLVSRSTGLPGQLRHVVPFHSVLSPRNFFTISGQHLLLMIFPSSTCLPQALNAVLNKIHPCSSCAIASASSSRIQTTLPCRPCLARSSGINPSPLEAFASAPRLRSMRTTSVCP